jgi:hypothetical protein
MARPWFEREPFYFRKRELGGLGALVAAAITFPCTDYLYADLSGWKLSLVQFLLFYAVIRVWNDLTVRLPQEPRT